MSYEEELKEGNLSSCHDCGSPVIRKRSASGTYYSTPINDAHLLEILSARTDLDMFIFERLRRAEHIITDLRDQINEMKNNE